MVCLRRGSVLDVDADRVRLGLRLRSAQWSWETPSSARAWGLFSRKREGRPALSPG